MPFSLASLYRRLSLAIARANVSSAAADYRPTSYMPLRTRPAAAGDPPALAADGRSTTDDGSSTEGVSPRHAYTDRDDDLKKDALGVRTEEVEPLVGRENLSSALPPHTDFWGYDQWDPAFTWTPQEERKVVQIADLKLMTCVCMMFLFLQLDRGNLANALTDNILADLGINTNAYNNGTTIQLICFLACEFPSQIILARVGFNRWLPFLMMCWGSVSCWQAFMTNEAGFYVTRALIGAFESGFIPGAVLYTSYWYKSGEMSIRLSFFWSTLNIARVLSALLAAGILKMRNAAGRPGWFWLFIIEGGLTMVMAVVAWFWLPWSPVQTKGGFWRKPWLTDRQQKIMVNRILRDDPAKGLSRLQNKITFKDCVETWKDPHLWCLVFIGLIAYIPASPVQGYMTLTIKRIGFSTFDTNMLTIPSAILQIITMLALSYSSDYFKERTFHCMFGELWILPCLIALTTMPAGGKGWERYALTTLISGYPYFHPIVSSWVSENSFSVKKRSVSLVTYNVVVQMGSVISSQLFRADDAPWYFRGTKVLTAICALSIVTFALTWLYFGHQNAEKEKIWQRMTYEERVAYQEDVAAREIDGLKRLDFRLTR